jgi:hypothetical protein
MACANQTLSGIGVPCDGSLGGIVEVYMTNYASDIYTYDETTMEVNGIKSGIT